MSTNSEQSIFFRGYLLEVWLRVRAYISKGFKNPSWLVMSVVGRFTIIRHFVVLLKRSVPRQEQPGNKTSVFADISISDVIKSLNQDGFHLRLKLPQPVLDRIVDFSLSTVCYGNQDSELGFLYRDKEKIEQEYGYTFFMAEYYNTSLLCQEIQNLSCDSQLLEIASRYLKAKPVFTGSRLWWNFVVSDDHPYDSSQTITFFHYDLDDYACVRFFFYLTDVDSRSGPHVCVRSSHMNKSLLHLLMPMKRRSDTKIQTFYGTDNIVTITGNKGFGFAEDTFCYHKATRPLDQDRLMLQIQFATKDYGLHNDLKDNSCLKHITEYGQVPLWVSLALLQGSYGK